MQISMASEPTPGRVNEDAAIAGPGWVAVLDGATAPAHIENGCAHDVPWLVRQLSAELAKNLTLDPGSALTALLACAIEATCSAHADSCDLDNPDSPSATVTILRRAGETVDYLALADSPLLLDTSDELVCILDDRTAHLSDYSYAGVRKARNSTGGFWVASTRPEAAYESVTGSLPATHVRRAALLTDGASRLVEVFTRLTWNELLDRLDTHGPRHLIAETRRAEKSAAAPADGRRRKIHDDATAVLIRM